MAVRQSHLVDTDTEFGPLEDLRETEIPQPLLVVPLPVPPSDDPYLIVRQAHTPGTIDIEEPGSKEEVAPKGQQQVVPVVDTAVDKPLGLDYGVLRRRELELREGLVPSTFEIGESSSRCTIGSCTCSDTTLTRVVIQFFTSFTIILNSSYLSSFTSDYPSSHYSSRWDEFLEVGAQLELHESILHDYTQHLDALPPTLFEGYDRDLRELYTRLREVKDEIFSQRYRLGSLEQEQERTTVTFGAIWRPVLALESWAGYVDFRKTEMWRARYDDHRLIHDLLVQNTTMQRELQEVRDCVTILEREGSRKGQ
nr:hypothetical protein [Tanacetum cinerariifolium]